MPSPRQPEAGRPLDPSVRPQLEARFGHDFSRVRVHTDRHAGASATALHAAAYSVGRHIVFAPGRYEPHTDRGRGLLAHELSHTIQQGMADPPAAPTGRRLPRNHPAEREARRAADHRSARGGIPIQARLPPVLALQDESAATPPPEAETDNGPESSGSSTMDSLIEQASIAVAGATRRSLPVSIPETVLAALTAAEAAFVERGFRRLVSGGELLAILRRVRELASPSVALEFAGRYIWGVLKGLVSPITGLVQFAIAGVELAGAAASWAVEQARQAPELSAEIDALKADLERFGATARANLESLRSRDRLLEFASAVFEAASAAGEAIEHQLVGMALRRGRQAADSLVNALRQTPLPELAETAGEIIGMVVIELVLLVFSEGIGNLISKLGEFARAMRPLSRGVAAFAEVAIGAGRIIAQLEHIVGRVMQRTVLRPLMPLFEALEPLLGRLRQLLRRILGLSEEAAAGLGRAGTRALSRSTSEAAGSAEGAVGARARPPAPTAGPEAPTQAAPTTPARAPTAPEPTVPAAATPARPATTAPPTRPAPGAAPPSTAPTPSRAPGTPPPAPPAGHVPSAPAPRGRPPTRGATAEGVGQRFRYEYHPSRPTPPVEHAPRRPGGAPRPTPQAPRPAAPAPRPPARRGLDLDDETRRMLAGPHAPEGETHLPPEDLSDLPVRQDVGRFDPATTEEDLALLAQEKFPQHRYDPRLRGREVFAGGRPVPAGRRPRGSTVPDLYARAPRRRPISLEAKNVYVGDPETWEDIISRTLDQARRRAAALPRTAQQNIVIDFRGQDVTREFAEGLRRELAARSGGLIHPDRIHFLPPSLD